MDSLGPAVTEDKLRSGVTEEKLGPAVTTEQESVVPPGSLSSVDKILPNYMSQSFICYHICARAMRIVGTVL